MECACIEGYDGNVDFYKDRNVKARKEHRCGECGEVIKIGEIYEYVFGKCEGNVFTAKTCLPCLEIRKKYFCSWEFEGVWEAMREVHGDIHLRDFEAFSPPAQQKILEMM